MTRKKNAVIDSMTERYRLQGTPELPPRYGGPGAATMVGQVTSAASRIAVGQFLEVNPVSVLGTEVEGGAGLTVVNTATTVPVYLVGPHLPATGDLLVCRFVDYRWVAERGGKTSTAATIPGCLCNPMPSSITLTANPNPGVNGWIQSCHFTYSLPPADVVAAGLATAGQMGLWSTAPLVDYQGDAFYFNLYCDPTFGYIYLGRSYTGPYTPGHGTAAGLLNYYRWLPGFSGNTCTPFSMTRGSVPGSSVTTTQASLSTP